MVFIRIADSVQIVPGRRFVVGIIIVVVGMFHEKGFDLIWCGIIESFLLKRKGTLALVPFSSILSVFSLSVTSVALMRSKYFEKAFY